jgi:hypothetical protein
MKIEAIGLLLVMVGLIVAVTVSTANSDKT